MLCRQQQPRRPPKPRPPPATPRARLFGGGELHAVKVRAQPEAPDAEGVGAGAVDRVEVAPQVDAERDVARADGAGRRLRGRRPRGGGREQERGEQGHGAAGLCAGVVRGGEGRGICRGRGD